MKVADRCVTGSTTMVTDRSSSGTSLWSLSQPNPSARVMVASSSALPVIKKHKHQSWFSSKFIYNCVCLLGLMTCYLRGTCRCLWCWSVVVSPQLWLKSSLQCTSCPLWRETDSRTYLSSGRPRHCSPGGNDFKILWNSVPIRYRPIGFYASLTSANTKPQSNG